MAARWILGFASSIFLLGFAAVSVSAANTEDVVCSGDLGSVTVRNVTVPSGASCTLRSATVTGGVTVSAAAYFQATGTRIAGDVAATAAQTVFVEGASTVGGGVRASHAAQVFLYGSRVQKDVKVDHATEQVFICGSSVVGGDIRVIRSSRNIVIGDARSGGCAGNSVLRGDMHVLWNKTDVELVVGGNRFPKGNLTVRGNTGSSEKIVQNNFGGKRIACQANAGRFRASKNRRWKSRGCSQS